MDPIHILSLGAGVQSSTMALMAACGQLRPMPKASIFADTQAEPPNVYAWLNWIEGQFPFPLYRVTAGSLTEDILTLRDRKDGKGHYVHSGIPTYNVNPDGSDGHVQRQCTTTFKIEPLDRENRRIIGRDRMLEWRRAHRESLKVLTLFNREFSLWKRHKKANVPNISPRPIRPKWAWDECHSDPLVIQWIGISLDEATRMKSPRQPWQNFRYPLIDLRMSRHDCLMWWDRPSWYETRPFKYPPRSACVYCPYHSDNEWRRLRDEEPESFAEAVRVDKEYRRLKGMAGMKGIPYLHASRIPLDQVDFRTDEDHGQQVMFQNECEGMCGV